MQTKYDELARLAGNVIDEEGDAWPSPCQFNEDGMDWTSAEFAGTACPTEIKAMHADLVKALADRDALAEVLEEVVACQSKHYGDGMRTHLYMINIADKARAALARVKEGA